MLMNRLSSSYGFCKIMTKPLIEKSRQRRQFADVALLATTCALVVSLAVATVTVFIGIAHAETRSATSRIAAAGDSAVALVLGLVIAGMGGLTAVMVDDGERPQRRD